MSDKSWEPDHSLTLSLSHSFTLSLLQSHSLSLSHSLTLVILNNFCFHVYAQKSLSHSHTLSFTHSPHAEQLLFSCLCSKVTLTLSHTLSISHSITLDMLNKFCFHVHAHKSLFMAENCNAFFGTSSPSPVSLDVIELVPS